MDSSSLHCLASELSVASTAGDGLGKISGSTNAKCTELLNEDYALLCRIETYHIGMDQAIIYRR